MAQIHERTKTRLAAMKDTMAAHKSMLDAIWQDGSRTEVWKVEQAASLKRILAAELRSDAEYAWGAIQKARENAQERHHAAILASRDAAWDFTKLAYLEREFRGQLNTPTGQLDDSPAKRALAIREQHQGDKHSMRALRTAAADLLSRSDASALRAAFRTDQAAEVPEEARKIEQEVADLRGLANATYNELRGVEREASGTVESAWTQSFMKPPMFEPGALAPSETVPAPLIFTESGQ